MAAADIEFMAVGAAQDIGDSCYFLRFGDETVMLECGAKRVERVSRGPALDMVIRAGMVEKLSQLNSIIISHAHMDHVGYLPYVLTHTGSTPIYMTTATRLLTEYQLFDRRVSAVMGYTPEQCMLQEQLASRTQEVSFLQTVKGRRGGVAYRFLPAGHIPGAMMTLLHYKGRTVLYTGDYSLTDTALTAACMVPKEPIDVLIICGTHAKHPQSRGGGATLLARVQQMFLQLYDGRSVCCEFNQLSKGVEVLKGLNNFAVEWDMSVPIYISPLIWRLVERLEEAGMSLLGPGNYLDDGRPREGPYIRLCTYDESFHSRRLFHDIDWCIDRSTGQPIREINLNADFTLHDSFDEMTAFIKAINPRQAVVVHSPGVVGKGTTIEQVLMRDSSTRTQFLFPEQGTVYRL